MSVPTTTACTIMSNGLYVMQKRGGWDKLYVYQYSTFSLTHTHTRASYIKSSELKEYHKFFLLR